MYFRAMDCFTSFAMTTVLWIGLAFSREEHSDVAGSDAAIHVRSPEEIDVWGNESLPGHSLVLFLR